MPRSPQQYPLSLFVAASFASTFSAIAHSQLAPASTPYVDRLMAVSALDAANDSDTFPADTNGWPRSMRIAMQWAQTRNDALTTKNASVALRAAIDTINFGTISLEGQISPYSRSTGLDSGSPTNSGESALGSLTLTQLRMPLARGWSMNNTLGILTPTQTSIAQRQGRVGLPSRSVQGGTTEFKSPDGTAAVASVGRLGQLEGYPAAGFRATGGTYAQVGGQGSHGTPQGMHTLAVNLANASGSAQQTNGTSLFAAHRLEEKNFSVQSNIVGTKGDGASAKTLAGYWIDATLDQQRGTHTGGIFSLARDLNFAGAPMNNDVRGAYYRYGYQTLQLVTNVTAEVLQPVSGDRATGTYLSANARYQISRNFSTGGGVAVRKFNGNGWQTFAYMQADNALGTGRAQVDIGETTNGERSHSLALDQTFNDFIGLRLSTSLTLQRVYSADIQRQTLGASLAGSYELTDNITIDTNLQSRTSLSGVRDDALYSTTNIAWRFNRNWSLAASANIGRGRYESGSLFDALDPLAPPKITTTRPTQRAFFLTLRYENQAGRMLFPLGGNSAGGAGNIQGLVFLDANANGIADAKELGAANVVVLLDGRFSTRTDTQGRYAFPFVAAGIHTLSVVTDNLPLPWTMRNDGNVQVEVSARQLHYVDLAAVKL